MSVWTLRANNGRAFQSWQCTKQNKIQTQLINNLNSNFDATTCCQQVNKLKICIFITTKDTEKSNRAKRLSSLESFEFSSF